jgi:hypothetical protein
MANEESPACDHNIETKSSEFIPSLSIGRHEIYRCQCGALFDLRHPDNQGDSVRAMTAREIDRLIILLLDDQKSRLVDAVIAGVRFAISGWD